MNQIYLNNSFDHQYFLYRRMKSQNSKEQKSDFSYKETLNFFNFGGNNKNATQKKWIRDDKK